MSLKPLVSAVITTFNRADTVGLAIQSALNQSYSPLEVVVVDDGSDDRTANAVGRFEHEVSYIQLPENMGIVSAQAIGVEHSSGEFIAHLDSDDEWISNKIERQIGLMGSASPDRVVYSQVVMSSGVSETVLPDRGISEGQGVAEYIFVEKGLMQTSTLLVPRELATQVRIPASIVRHVDYAYCLSLESLGAHFRFVDAPLTVWHTDPRPDRVSLSTDYVASLRWLEVYEARLSRSAQASFLLVEVLPKLLALDEGHDLAIRIILRAARERVISRLEALSLLVRVPVPRKLRRRIGGIVSRLRPRG